MDHFISLLPFKRLPFGEGERKVEGCAEREGKELGEAAWVARLTECQINFPSLIWMPATPTLLCSPRLAFHDLLNVSLFLLKLYIQQPNIEAKIDRS